MAKKSLMKAVLACGVLLFVLVSFDVEAGLLAWPLRNDDGRVVKVFGTYGDLRASGVPEDWIFHTGVDLHKRVGSYVYAAKPGLIVDDSYGSGSGWTYILKDGSGRKYGYAHLVRYNPATGEPWIIGQVVPDTLAAFCTVFDWDPDTAPDPHDHVHFCVGNTAGKWTNPIWQDASVEHLPWDFSGGPKINDDLNYEEGISYSKYARVHDADNQYFCPLEIWAGVDVDVIVYANSRASSEMGPVGVCKIEMYIEEFWQGQRLLEAPQSGATHMMDFTSELPANQYAQCVFGVDYTSRQSDPCQIIPETIQSDAPYDRMWYIITNFDENGDVYPNGHIGTDDAWDEAEFQMWITVTDHLKNQKTYGPIDLEVCSGPASLLAYLDATSTNRGIRLSWGADHSDNVVGFRVCRKGSAGDRFEALDDSWSPRATSETSIEHFSFLDTQVELGETWSYRVQALSQDSVWILLENEVHARLLPSAVAGHIVIGTAPNPFRDYIDIFVQSTSPSDGTVSLAVTDTRGREIWSSEVEYGAGTAIRWNGRANDGGIVPPGVYFCSASSGGRHSVVKVIRLK